MCPKESPIFLLLDYLSTFFLNKRETLDPLFSIFFYKISDVPKTRAHTHHIPFHSFMIYLIHFIPFFYNLSNTIRPQDH